MSGFAYSYKDYVGGNIPRDEADPGYMNLPNVDPKEFERAVEWWVSHGCPRPKRTVVRVPGSAGLIRQDYLWFFWPGDEDDENKQYVAHTDLAIRTPAYTLRNVQAFLQFGNPIDVIPYPPPPKESVDPPKPPKLQPPVPTPMQSIVPGLLMNPFRDPGAKRMWHLGAYQAPPEGTKALIDDGQIMVEFVLYPGNAFNPVPVPVWREL